MNCREFRRSYTAYRDGSEPALAAAMEDHLDACAACAAYDRTLREGVETLRGHIVRPSANFTERLEARLRSGEEVHEPVPPRVSPLVAMVMAALILSLFTFALRRTPVVSTAAAAEEPALLAKPRVVPGIPFIVFESTK